MASSTYDLSEFLNPPLCANADHNTDGEISPCEQPATMVCSGCYLVQYCSQACQKADWKLHKKTCKGEHFKETWRPRFITEQRIPAFMTQSNPSNFTLASFGYNHHLWGNVPAIDILRLDRNEGREESATRDFSLLFAASGDLRNVIKTVVGLPDNYTGECLVTINDHGFCVTARNIIMVLTAMHFPAETAVPIITHLWYSALLPERILQALHDGILPCITKVCDRISDEKNEAEHTETFKFGHGSVRIVLRKHQWMELANMLQPPRGLSAHDAMQLRHATTLAPKRIDYVDKALLKMPPARRTGAWRFRNQGLLLPFGASQKHFTVPNPTMFAKKNIWPMTDDADPLNGWAYHDYAGHAGAAKNDVYGAFFNFLRSLLLKFCRRIRAVKMGFYIFAVDAVTLPNYMGATKFDRIEVSSICDHGSVGVHRTLSTFAPLLKPKLDNPHATLLLLFMKAVREHEGISETHKWASRSSLSQPDPRRLEQVYKFMPTIVDMVRDPLSVEHALRHGLSAAADPIKLADAMDMVGDFDAHFEAFLRRPDARRAGRMSALAAANGVKLKTTNSIVKPWPFRITDETSEADFAILLAQGTWGHERYVEVEVNDDDESDQVS